MAGPADGELLLLATERSAAGIASSAWSTGKHVEDALGHLGSAFFRGQSHQQILSTVRRGRSSALGERSRCRLAPVHGGQAQ